MNVSVIIPTRNRSQVLLRCLNALIEQRGDVGAFEIIVVDDGSTDDTREMLTGLQIRGPVCIRLIELGSQTGPAAARNRGILEARHGIVVFIGDDIIVQPGFLKRHSEMHRRYRGLKTAVLGYTTWHPELEVTPFMAWLEGSGVQFDYSRVERLGPTWQHFYTSNISLKRGFMLDKGLFDEDFKHAAIEDTELGFRLFKRGLKIVYCKQASAYHFHPGVTSRDYCENAIFQRGFYEVVLQSKHRAIAELFDQDISYWRRVLVSAAVADDCASIEKLKLAAGSQDRASRVFAEHFGDSSFASISAFYRARGAVQNLLKEFPNLPAIGERLIEAYRAERSGDVRGALAQFLLAKREQPGLIGLVLLCADAFVRHTRFEEAEELYQNALEVAPGHAYASLHLGELLRRRDRSSSRARACYRAALQGEMLDAGSRSVAHIGLGLWRMATNAPKSALHSFRKACEVAAPDPNQTASALIHCAEACEALGGREEAHGLLAQVDCLGQLSPETRAGAAFFRSILLWRDGRPAQALRLLADVRTGCAGDDRLAAEIEFKMGQMELELKRRKRALDHFKMAASMQAPAPLGNQAASLAADALIEEDRLDEALSYLREIVSASASGDLLCSARLRIGSILFEKQDFEGALREFRLAADSRTKDRLLLGWVFFSVAQCLKQLGGHNEAARYFTASQRLLSGPEILVSSFWEHARLAYGGKRPGKAISDFVRCIESVVKEKRDAQEIAFRSVMALHEAGAFDAASRLLKSLSEVIDLEGRFWRLALAYKRRGILTSAEEMMSSLEFLPPSEQAEWHLSAASLLLEMGYDQDAEDEVRSALQLRSEWPHANYVLGSILEKRRNFDEASARFESVLERADTVGKDLWSKIVGGAHYHLACIFERRGEKERALEHLESCLEIMPRHRKAAELRLSLLCMAAPVSR
ncbi:MAG: glycosyltransferase [Candidatus Coatesbacteria bacterium]|nr:glycosyltransferase [Candidatus Coatesbacteria bacterium]